MEATFDFTTFFSLKPNLDTEINQSFIEMAENNPPHSTATDPMANTVNVTSLLLLPIFF